MNSRERIKAILNFEIPDRIGICDAPWPAATERWHREGLPQNIHPNEYFHFDVNEHIFLNSSFMLPEKIIEETEEWIIRTNSDGVTEQAWKNNLGPPHSIDFLIKEEKDWREHKGLLRPSLDRMDFIHWGDFWTQQKQETQSASPGKKIEKYRKIKPGNRFIFFSMQDPYEASWPRYGQEKFLMDMINNPDLIKDMFAAHVRLVIESYEILKKEGIKADGIFLGGDVAYKNGLLFSPRCYREMLFPCHRKICDFFKGEGLPVVYHTDGNISEILPLLIEAGINGINPIEVQAGNDLLKLKAEYGKKVVFMGGIDAKKMEKREDIEKEIREKITLVKEGGSYIYHSDHSVPPTVSLENYKYLIELVNRSGGY